jgi:hypothetical protein
MMGIADRSDDSPGLRVVFRGTAVWLGIAMAITGLLCEELVPGDHAFESLMFFGGLSLGMGLMYNRCTWAAMQSNKPVQPDGPSGRR